MRLMLLPTLAVLALHCRPASASERAQAPVPSASAFVKRYGPGWIIVKDQVTQAPSFAYGKQFAPPITPRSLDDFEVAARLVVDENVDFLGVDSRDLESGGVKALPLVDTSAKVAVRFRQVVGGVPVLHGGVTVLFDAARGSVLAIDTTAVPYANLVPLHPASPPHQAIEAATRAYLEAFGIAATSVERVDLTIVGPSAYFGRKSVLTGRGPTLAYAVDLSSGGALTHENVPAAARVFVSAEGDLAVFKVQPTIFATITGNVKGNVNTGPEPNTNSNQEQPNLSNVWVRQNNSSGPVLATTDQNGDFSINQDGPITLFFELRGPYDNVNNQGGSDASFTVTANAGSPVNILFNPTLAEFTTAEVAGHYWVNAFRDWVRGVDPGDTTMDFNVVCNVNLNSTCNAYYDGASINMYRSGGGCPNTAYRTVIHHEEGHWANEKYNGGVSGAFHEGAADAWAYYIGDDPCLGPDFFGPGTGCLRSGEQTSIKKCANDGESCHGGEVHTEGEVLGAGLWKVRARLKSTLGTGPGGAVASGLFLAWFQTYNDSSIREVICDHWLALDDDNGDLNDGTPHFNDVNEGFRDQGWQGFDLPDLSLSVVSAPAMNAGVGNFQPQTIVATITSAQGSVTAAEIKYSNNDGASFTTVAMTPTGNPNEYSGVIPGFASPDSIRWYLRATSSVGGVKTLPAGAPDDYFIYHAGVVTLLASYVFDGGNDEGWTHASLSGGALGDQWERLDPSSSNESTDPPDAYSQARNWGTDLSGAGTDGKYEPSTSGELRSPLFNFTGVSNVRLQYRRWLAVEEGQFDQAAIYVNTTKVWNNPNSGDLIDSAWAFQDLDVSAPAANNASVQFKWRMTADSGTEYGGWNIDDVALLEIEPNPTGSFTNYGTGCGGTGGLVPALAGSGNPTPGGLVTFSVTNGLPFGSGLIITSLSPASLPLPGGCTLLVGVPFASTFSVMLNSGGAANLAGSLPGGTPTDVHLYFQFFGFDAGSGNGQYSSSNGVDMHIL
ncbi:MAG: hypothetical protein U1E76_13425 [Planctomycetota bacterium]